MVQVTKHVYVKKLFVAADSPYDKQTPGWCDFRLDHGDHTDDKIWRPLIIEVSIPKQDSQNWKKGGNGDGLEL